MRSRTAVAKRQGGTRTLVARPAPPGEAEQASDHEQAGAGLGDHRDAKPPGLALKGRDGEVPGRHGEEGRVVAECPAAEPAAQDARGAVDDDRLDPLPDVAALVERAIRARRASVAALDREVAHE